MFDDSSDSMEKLCLIWDGALKVSRSYFYILIAIFTKRASKNEENSSNICKAD
jgi:hypothetical protein